MGSQRIARINQLGQREVAGMLPRLMNESGFDLSAVTVTHVLTSSDLRHARVLVSIRGSAAEQQRMLRQLARHRAEMQRLLSRHIILKYTPKLSFALDESIAQGSDVLHLIAKMEAEHPEWSVPEPPAPPPDNNDAET
jgi:ribosome-binding factor A